MINCRIAPKIAFTLLELCGSLVANNTKRASWPEWVVCCIEAVASEHSEDVDCRYLLCFLCTWSVRFVVFPLYFNITWSGHNLHATLIHKTVFLYKTEVLPYACFPFLVWHYFVRLASCLLHIDCSSRKFFQRGTNKILELPFWMLRRTWRKFRRLCTYNCSLISE